MSSSKYTSAICSDDFGIIARVFFPYWIDMPDDSADQTLSDLEEAVLNWCTSAFGDDACSDEVTYKDGDKNEYYIPVDTSRRWTWWGHKLYFKSEADAMVAKLGL